MSKSRILAKSTHANDRAEKRFGVRFTKKEMLEIAAKCRDRIGVLMREQRDNKELWCVTYQGKAMRVVYNRRQHALVTVMSGPGKEPPNRRKG